MDNLQDDLRRELNEAAAAVRAKLPESFTPEAAVILGTGLSPAMDGFAAAGRMWTKSIPHHPVSTVESHAGRLSWGTWSGRHTLVFQGRIHLYEGYSAREVVFPVRLAAALGVKTLILTNAAGGLNPGFHRGDLMLLTDHLNLTGHNPLRGPDPDPARPRFPAMTEPYSRRLREIAARAAGERRIPVRAGIYVAVLGPSLETAAETRFLRLSGADAVGMSTVLETIAAVHAGVDVLGISIITNVNNPDAYEPATLGDIVDAATEAAPNLASLISATLASL